MISEEGYIKRLIEHFLVTFLKEVATNTITEHSSQMNTGDSSIQRISWSASVVRKIGCTGMVSRAFSLLISKVVSG